MRINEVAQLEVKDVYRPNGELKKTFIIPAKYTKTNRRTLAAWLDRKGCDLELIRYILNHEDPEMTIEHIDPSLKRIEEVYRNLMRGVKMPEALR